MSKDNELYKKCAHLLSKVNVSFDIDEIDYNARKFDIRLSATSEDISFDVLYKLSELFQTNLINLGSETREEGYCESCSYTRSVVVIRINKATL